MKFIRKITKEGLKTNGGGIIPSPFVFEGEVTGIMIAQDGVGWKGEFKASVEEEDGLIVKGTKSHNRRGFMSTIGAIATDCCSCSDNGLVYTIDEAKLLIEVDKAIASRLGCDIFNITQY